MTEIKPTALLLLEDGSIFWGHGFGFVGQTSGEVCFNTSMTGYQEILTDPSYAGQMVVFTFPHIGIVGCNELDNEITQVELFNQQPSAIGVIMREDLDNFTPSNWRAKQKDGNFLRFHQWLQQQQIPAIAGVDTRQLTKKIRQQGAMLAILQHNPNGTFDLSALTKKLQQLPPMQMQDLSKVASRANKGMECWQEGEYMPTKNDYVKTNDDTGIRPLVAVYDYGVKNNILRILHALGADVRLYQPDTPAATILAAQPAGIFLSNGPGDPAATAMITLPAIKQLLQERLPIFGVCMGHQLLALALGGRTEKMQFGHRGANHPVKDLCMDKVLITSQNHGFVVADDLPKHIEVTHRSLFDGSVAGIKMLNRPETAPVFSVQFHPEASPGPMDNRYLFENFMAAVKKNSQLRLIKTNASSISIVGI